MELPFVRSVNVTAKNRDKIIEAKEKMNFIFQPMVLIL